MKLEWKEPRTRRSVLDVEDKVSAIMADKSFTASETIFPGWSDIIGSMIDDIRDYDPTVRITRLHCWYGGLSVHVTHGDDQVYKRLFNAEREAFNTCEICGRAGTFLGLPDGQSKTLCPRDAKTHLTILGHDITKYTPRSRFRFRLFGFRNGSAKFGI